jgi:hypothetical protein
MTLINPMWGMLDKEHKKFYTKTITIGADPEFSLSFKGEPVSAHDIVPGTKEKPHQFEHGYGSVQSDGTAVEIGISPCPTPYLFGEAIIRTMNSVRQMVDKRLDFNFAPTRSFPAQVWRKLPAEVKEIGCSPDNNIHTGAINLVPRLPARSAFYGGHIHVGFRDPTVKPTISKELIERENLLLVKNMQNEFHHFIYDEATTRSDYYHTCFRHKPYGFEFRSFSNSWLGWDQKQLMHIAKAVFGNVRDSIAHQGQARAHYATARYRKPTCFTKKEEDLRSHKHA